MKIFINAVGARMGGAARHLPAFLHALATAEPDWTFHVCVSQGQKERVPDLPQVAVSEVESHGVLGRLRWEMAGICHHASGAQADCILNLTNHGPMRRCIPSILYQRNALHFDPSWTRRLPPVGRIGAWIRRAAAFREVAAADAVVTPTEAMAGFLRSWRSAPKDFVNVVVPHAAEASTTPYQPRPLTTLENVTLAVVSHPAPHKGIDTAIRTVAELARDGFHPTLLLTINRFGYAKPFQRYVEDCASLATELGVEGAVHFLGSTDDVATVYSMCDVVLVPSLTESFGFPLVEAMASGTPLLASAIPASLEVAGDHARWFPPGDHQAAVTQLRQMAALPRPEAMLVLAGARERAESLTWERNARNLADLIGGCIARASR